VRVQQFVRLVAQRAAQKLLVDPLDLGILVTAADRVSTIAAVERFGAGRQALGVERNGIAPGIRLAAPADAASGAAHDFDEVVFLGFGANHLQQFVSVSEPVRDGDPNFLAVHLKRAFLDPGESADGLQLDVDQGFAGEQLVGGAYGGFHHTARDTEDRGRPGGHAERFVEAFALNVDEVDAGRLDHPGQLARGQDHVGVRAPVHRELRPGRLGFLGRAGHHRHDEHLGSVDPFLLGEIGP